MRTILTHLQNVSAYAPATVNHNTRIMPHCIAFDCKNNSKDYKHGISFCRPVKYLAGQASAQRPPPIKESSCVCSGHFTYDCFEMDVKSELMPGTKLKCMLKLNAVPTLFSFVKSSKRSTFTRRIKGIEAKQVSIDFGWYSV